MTRYSRSTWKKSTLKTHMNTQIPLTGNKACQLCQNGEMPEHLSKHVSEYKTCGDMHLSLSLLTVDQNSCTQGQENYREKCCPPPKKGLLKGVPSVALGATAGAVAVWYIVRRILRGKRSRKVQDLPPPKNKEKKGNHKTGSGEGDIELNNNKGPLTNYARMDDNNNGEGRDRSFGSKSSKNSKSSSSSSKKAGNHKSVAQKKHQGRSFDSSKSSSSSSKNNSSKQNQHHHPHPNNNYRYQKPYVPPPAYNEHANPHEEDNSTFCTMEDGGDDHGTYYTMEDESTARHTMDQEEYRHQSSTNHYHSSTYHPSFQQQHHEGEDASTFCTMDQDEETDNGTYYTEDNQTYYTEDNGTYYTMDESTAMHKVDEEGTTVDGSTYYTMDEESATLNTYGEGDETTTTTFNNNHVVEIGDDDNSTYVGAESSTLAGMSNVAHFTQLV